MLVHTHAYFCLSFFDTCPHSHHSFPVFYWDRCKGNHYAPLVNSLERENRVGFKCAFLPPDMPTLDEITMNQAFDDFVEHRCYTV